MMSYEFDKDILFGNIAYLLKEREKKIGELESDAGVSPGYISRTSKEENTRPGIDFIVKVAEVFEVSMDTLLRVKLYEISSTEKYILSFLEKLNQDTIQEELDWKREIPDSLNHQDDDILDKPIHPLFEYKEYFQENGSEYPDLVKRYVFMSREFGTNTWIEDDCFNLKINHGVTVYVMNLSKMTYKYGDKNNKGKEVWLYSGGTPEYLCGNSSDNELGFLVDNLYSSIAEYSKHPKIDERFRKAIDSFMNGGDDKDDFPF